MGCGGLRAVAAPRVAGRRASFDPEGLQGSSQGLGRDLWSGCSAWVASCIRQGGAGGMLHPIDPPHRDRRSGHVAAAILTRKDRWPLTVHTHTHSHCGWLETIEFAV